jgi:hypothetical protein
MSFNAYTSQIRTIKHTDPRFIIKDKLMVSTRAGFEVNPSCPIEYTLIIAECINRGWLKPIARVTERELIFIGLTND